MQKIENDNPYPKMGEMQNLKVDPKPLDSGTVTQDQAKKIAKLLETIVQLQKEIDGMYSIEDLEASFFSGEMGTYIGFNDYLNHVRKWKNIEK